MAIVLALGCALVAAAVAVLQRLGVQSAPASSALRLRLVTHAMRRGVWLAGFALLPAQFVLQVMALRFGPLSVVQPALTAELLFLVLILTVAFGQRPRRRDWLAAAAVVAGLAGFLVAAAPSGGRGAPDLRGWVVVSAVATVAVVVLVVGGLRGPRWWRAAAYGAASAVLFAVNATLTKALTARIELGWAHVFVSPVPYVLAATGLAGFFLLQSALHAGPVTASRATTVIVNPTVSIVIGATVLGEHLRPGLAAAAAQAAALAVLVLGALALARSSLVAGALEDAEMLRWRVGAVPRTVAGTAAAVEGPSPARP